ncbi:MAG: hypothetical protein RMK30_06700 [Anaerolineae bacterium]|nr:hypothetical protein [Anaerolineae bacterium]MDW8102548.1 hypothetical protein [Anaerolineae bacterium]
MEKRGLEIAVEVPTSVREALGDKATLDLLSWFVKAIPSVAVTREEFKEVIFRLERMEEDLKGIRTELAAFRESVDRRFELVDKRFDAIHDRIDALRKDMDERFDSFQREVNGRIDALRKDMDERFDSFHRSMEARLDLIQERMLAQSRWLIGSIAVLGTVISILLAIGQFVR